MAHVNVDALIHAQLCLVIIMDIGPTTFPYSAWKPFGHRCWRPHTSICEPIYMPKTPYQCIYMLIINNSNKHTSSLESCHKINVVHTIVILVGHAMARMPFMLWVLAVNFAMLLGHTDLSPFLIDPKFHIMVVGHT